MKSSLLIKYGGVVRNVDIPIQFNSVSLEDSIRDVFKLSNKSIFGLRYPTSDQIFVLDEITSKDSLSSVITDDDNPLVIVFHNSLSNCRCKENLMEKEQMTEYLNAVGIQEPFDEKSLADLFSISFNVCVSVSYYPKSVPNSRLHNFFGISDENPMTMDIFYEKVVYLTEIPLSKRLHILFTLVGSEGDHISLYQLQWVLRLLYWQEACCFVTGRFCSCLDSHFFDVAHALTELIRMDYRIDYSGISYENVLFWLLNRGHICFSPSFYGTPSAELEKASVPLTHEDIAKQRLETIHFADVECIYYMYEIFISFYHALSLSPSIFEELIEVLSGYMNEDGTINDEDFSTALYTVVDESEDSDKEIIIKIDSFCDFCFLLFHEDEDSDSVNFIYYVTLLCILQFLTTKEIEEPSNLLMTYLVDDSNPNVVSTSMLESFFHSVIWLMTGVSVDVPGEDGLSIRLLSSQKTKEDQHCVVNDLIERVSSFGSLSHVVNPTMREKMQLELKGVDGIHRDVEMIVVQHIFLCFLRRWDYQQFNVFLIQLLETPHLDSLLAVGESVKEVKSDEKEVEGHTNASVEDIKSDGLESKEHIDDSVEEVKSDNKEANESFDSEKESAQKTEESACEMKESANNSIELFSYDSAIGVALHTLLRQLSLECGFRSLSVVNLLHVFSSFNRCYECEDNMFFSEFSELLIKLFPSLLILPQHYSLFMKLSHKTSPRIDRFVLLYILLFFCSDLDSSNSADIFFELLLVSSNSANRITSFDRFVRAALISINLVMPRLLMNLEQDNDVLVFRINKQLFDAFSVDNSINSISKVMFLKKAKDLFRIDEMVRYGRSVFDDHVGLLRELFGIQSSSLEDICCVLNSKYDKELISVSEFINIMDCYFPLMPLSQLKKKRKEELDILIALLSHEGKISKTSILSAFSVIMGPRSVIWNSLLELLHIEGSENRLSVLRVMIRTFIAMSLFVQIDYYDSSLLHFFHPIIDTMLSKLPERITNHSVILLFYENLKMILPVSYFPRLTISPVIYYHALMNLRYLSGLGNILFTRLVEMINSFEHDIISKQDYYRLIEYIYTDKPLDFEKVYEIFNRIYSCCQLIKKNPLGVCRDTLVFMLSSFYPNNTAVGFNLVKRWNEKITWNVLKYYLECVYCALNEFFYCFDTTVVTLELVAINVATSCFKSFNVDVNDQLSTDQFMSWMKRQESFSISKDSAKVSYYPQYTNQEWKVDYRSLCQETNRSIMKGSQMYEPIDYSQADIQMFEFNIPFIISCLDTLVSFAAEKNLCNCSDEIARCISRQMDPDGLVARSSFVSSIGKIVMDKYMKNMNSERELFLEDSLHSPSVEDDINLRDGLKQLFDSLDVSATHLVDSHQLIAVLSLLSEGSMVSRLRYMLVESTPEIGDMVYLKNIVPAVSAFYLFIDHLLPGILYYRQITPLLLTNQLLTNISKEVDGEIIEVDALVNFLYRELVEFSETMRSITASEKGIAASFPLQLLSFKLCNDASQLIDALLLKPQSHDDTHIFFTEEFVAREQLSHGLLHQRLNRVLLRDELRRLLYRLRVNLPVNCAVQFEKYLLDTIGDGDSILYEDFITALIPFISYCNNYPLTVVRGMSSVFKVLNENQDFKFSELNSRIQIIVTVVLWIAGKETLLSAPQVTLLLRELLELGEEDTTVSLNNFIGGSMLHSVTPSSLNMQRFMAVILVQARGELRNIWDGEMPFNN